MRLVTIFVGCIALLDAITSRVSALERNPIDKIEKHLSTMTSSDEPSTNIQLAKEYYNAQKKKNHLLRSNKRLLEVLEKFIALQKIVDGNESEYCSSNDYHLIQSFKDAMRGCDKSSMGRLSIVFNRIKQDFAESCREFFYSFAIDCIQSIEETSSGIRKIFKPVVASIVSDRRKGESVLSALDRKIFKANAADLIDKIGVNNLNLSCRKNCPGLDNEQRFEQCIIDPCKTYISTCYVVFEMADQVGLVVNTSRLSDQASSETISKTRGFAEALADFRLCRAAVHRTAKKMAQEIDYNL